MISNQKMSRAPGRGERALSRRGFLQASAAVGGGLMLSLRLPFATGAAEAADETFAPNAFIRIGRDGRIVLTMPYVEMGQGTYTSIPMLIAEELNVSYKTVVNACSQLKQKLNAKNLPELIRLAVQLVAAES